MTSTKLMLLGILLSLMGLAVNSVVAQYAAFRVLDTDALNVLDNAAIARFLAGFIVGLIGFFRR
ncbi:MAG TPA: hypothetical protein VF792_00865 [Ktedonobacterales bacterium]